MLFRSNAKSVAYAAKGGSGKMFMALLDRLDIKDEVQAKIMPVGSPTVGAVVRGDAQFVFTSVGLILADAEAELVAPLPAEVQTYAHIAIGTNPAAAQLVAAREFARFVTGAAALPVVYLTAHHMMLFTGRLRRGSRVLVHSAAGGVGKVTGSFLRPS